MPDQPVIDVTYTPDPPLEILNAVGSILASVTLLRDGAEQPTATNREAIQAEGNDEQGFSGGGEVRMGSWQYKVVAVGTDTRSVRTTLNDALRAATKLRVGTVTLELSGGGMVEDIDEKRNGYFRATISVIPLTHLASDGSIGLV